MAKAARKGKEEKGAQSKASAIPDKAQARPRILAKAALRREQVASREAAGCDGIEYQMLASDFDDRGCFLGYAAAARLAIEHPLHAIHLPAASCNIEDADAAPMLAQAARLAQTARDANCKADPTLMVEVSQGSGRASRLVAVEDACRLAIGGRKLKAAERASAISALAQRALEEMGEARMRDFEARRASAQAQRQAWGGVRPVVVTHNELHFEDWGRSTLSRVSRLLAEVLEDCPDVDVAIENTTAMRHLQEGSSKLSSGYLDSPVLAAEALRREIGCVGRIHTCLDICHSRISELQMGKQCASIDGCGMGLSLRSFFELYAPTCGLLHFAGISGNGYGGGHGVPFVSRRAVEAAGKGALDGAIGDRDDDAANMEALALACSLYRELGMGCPITLEVSEADIVKADGYALSKAAFDEVWEAL